MITPKMSLILGVFYFCAALFLTKFNARGNYHELAHDNVVTEGHKNFLIFSLQNWITLLLLAYHYFNITHTLVA